MTNIVAILRKKFPTITLAVLMAFGAVTATVATASPASASSTICKTVTVSKQSVTYTPRLTVPICYNGSKVWQNGGVTPGGTFIGYQASYGWYGTYHDSSQTWLGAGENITLNFGIGPVSYTINCAPRWIFGAGGQVTSSTFGC